MQKSPVLAGPFQDCERLALEGDRRAKLDIRRPVYSQAMIEGALRSFYRPCGRGSEPRDERPPTHRCTGRCQADTIDLRGIVLAKRCRLAALG
jgi:hypothetical protein